MGPSETGAATIRRAAAVHPIVDVQIEYSLVSRGIEAEILPAAESLRALELKLTPEDLARIEAAVPACPSGPVPPGARLG